MATIGTLGVAFSGEADMAASTFFSGVGMSTVALIILILSSISYSRAGRVPTFSKPYNPTEHKPTSNVSHRAKLKKIGIGIGIAFGVFIALGIIGASLSNESIENEAEIANESSIIVDKPREKAEITNESIFSEESQDTSKVSFSYKVEDCTREVPKVANRPYDKYVSSDCLIQKAETVADCKAYTNVVLVEYDTISSMGNLKHVKQYFTEVEECVTKIALQNHDVGACNSLDDNTNCIVKYAEQFNEPQICQQAADSLNCFKTVSLTLGFYVCNVIKEEETRLDCGTNYILRAQYNEDYSTDKIRERCTFRHNQFVVNEVACQLDRLRLDGIAKRDLLSWKAEDGLAACFRYDSPIRVLDREKWNDYCIASISVYLNDLLTCDQAGQARAECYGFVATTEDSIGLDTCDKLGNSASFCYMHVAYRLNDITICDMQEVDSNKDNCLRLVRSKSDYYSQALTDGPAVCKLIQNDNSVLDCVKFYFTSLNNLSWIEDEEVYKKCIDVGLGNFLVKQVACKLEHLPLDGLTKNDLIEWSLNGVDICRPFNPPSHLNEHDYCIGSLGVYTKDLSFCDKAVTARAECYGVLAITEDFVKLSTCDKLDTGVSFCYMAVAYRLNDITICKMDKVADNKDNCIRLLNSRKK